MKRLFLLPLLFLTLAVGGCASLGRSDVPGGTGLVQSIDNLFSDGKSILAGGTSVTATRSNPVTPQMLYTVENGLIVAVSALQTYKDLCARKAIDRSCRTVVAEVQSYTIKVRKALPDLRRFVRNNDQINAIQAFNAVRGLLASAQATAAANGVN